VARRAVHTFAVPALSPAVVEVAELLASELVTNALAHGNGRVKVLMECGAGGLAVTVCDDHPARPEVVEAEPLAPGGRGLHMVQTLAQEWGVVPADEGPGKGVWFRLAG
jgi:two-component sensor histidine kinase